MPTYYSGTEGTFQFNGDTLYVKGWSASIEEEQLDVTNKSSNGYKEYIGGLKGISGSADIFYTGNALEVGSSGSFTFNLPDTKTITGTGRLSKIDYDSPVDGVCMVKVEVQGTGSFTVGGS